ncbi:putative arginase family protein [Phaeomoniella chlamydospora]|uniref:Putative arginase family protein n=1 Tax=Phaeomoniella chlamydospora TaxID=158046 RepID=A0A0G2G0I6_PHACM|nr:putative arginase family protein [Phaeomoniella chlamydospora]
MKSFSPLLSLFATSAFAREIDFPPVGGLNKQERYGQTRLYAEDMDDGISLETDPTAGLNSFGHMQFVPCFSPKADEDIDRYDIAVLGAPFDTGTSYRPGARFGPHGIRDGSRRIRGPHSWNIYSRNNPFTQWAKVVDCGDAPLTFVDNTVALKQLGKAHKIISGRLANNDTISKTPRILMLGGDHTITLAALRSTFERWGIVNVIHFDSHIDTWNPNVLGDSINHGTFLHIAHEEGLISNHSSIHAGIRAPLGTRDRDIQNDVQCGFDIITARDIDDIGVKGIIKQIKERVGNGKVYISVDIDVLDPAFAPATGTAEPGGWSTRELLSIIDGLTGLKVVGADVVEVAPAYDNTGETTCIAAGEVARSLLGLMVDTPVKD